VISLRFAVPGIQGGGFASSLALIQLVLHRRQQAQQSLQTLCALERHPALGRVTHRSLSQEAVGGV
jgi:hypothetical protein